MLNCFLYNTRRVKHTIPFKKPTHTHEFDELTYFISGQGSTKIRDKEYSYKNKMFAFYKAGTEHDETDPVTCDIIWSRFHYKIDGITLKEGVFEDPHGELLLLIQKLRRISLESGTHNSVFVESCLAEVIATAARLQERSECGRVDATDWQRILDFIDENSNTDIDFVELSMRYHYSYDRFRHLFREKFGISPYSYLLMRRIEHAEDLLSGTSASLTDVAFDCGFASSSQFTNTFKKYTGETPGDYRKKRKDREMTK